MNRLTGRWALILGVFVLTVVACGGDSVGLSDQTWTLTEVDGTSAVPTAIATLTFDADGTLSGNTGCNAFTTSYEADGSSLTIVQPVAATLRACEEPVMTQETALFEAFAGTKEFSISGSSLELIGEASATLASYSAES